MLFKDLSHKPPTAGWHIQYCERRAKCARYLVDRVHFEGRVSRAGVAQILASSRAGLVVLKLVAHEMEAYPIKLFEYMAAGLLVISSDFPIWRGVVEGKCGLLVDPEKTNEITKAMQWIRSSQ